MAKGSQPKTSTMVSNTMASTLAKKNSGCLQIGIIEKRDAQINAAQAAEDTAPLHNYTRLYGNNIVQ